MKLNPSLASATSEDKQMQPRFGSSFALIHQQSRFSALLNILFDYKQSCGGNSNNTGASINGNHDFDNDTSNDSNDYFESTSNDAFNNDTSDDGNDDINLDTGNDGNHVFNDDTGNDGNHDFNDDNGNNRTFNIDDDIGNNGNFNFNDNNGNLFLINTLAMMIPATTEPSKLTMITETTSTKPV